MAKLGPFCRRDNCSGMRGVLDRLMTHLLVQSLVLHVSLELRCGCPGVAVGAGSALEEGVGAMGVAGTAGLLLACKEVLEKLDGTFRCLLKV